MEFQAHQSFVCTETLNAYNNVSKPTEVAQGVQSDSVQAIFLLMLSQGPSAQRVFGGQDRDLLPQPVLKQFAVIFEIAEAVLSDVTSGVNPTSHRGQEPDALHQVSLKQRPPLCTEFINVFWPPPR
eukprot:2591448-Amphidinium_carterae.1